MDTVDSTCTVAQEHECPSPDERGSMYSVMAFFKMNTFRKRGQLCDVVIKVGGREFLAHRVVLAATSDYFDAMFSNGMAESAQLEVELKSISPDVMDALLDYVYTGQVRVTMENVQDLLPAASLVQMEGVKTACSNFLLAEVDASNVLGIRRFAELHSCDELEKFTRNYAAHNFEMVVEYEEFLCLNHEELLDLITREDLHIDSEESVYKAVMRWVYHQPPTRATHLLALLRNIRLPVMSVRFLTDVVDQDALIRQSLECRDLVDDAKRFHLRPDLRHEMRERRYRQRDGGDEYLVVIGGFGSDQNPSDSVEMFNPRSLEWSELPDLPISYRYVAACSLDTCVYVIGGFDGQERLNTMCMLDIAQREEGWRWLTSMHCKRGLSAACTHKGLIYVCGGFDGRARLRSLEVYHPKIDEWRILEDMTTAREGAGLVVVDDSLYCLGGYDGFHLLNSMEAFDLRRGTWSVCKPMYMRRSGAGCALLGDTIYVCGGYGGAEGRGPLHLDTVEAYNTRLTQWTLITSMNVPRCYVGACPLAGKIYVAAGYNGNRLLDTVESYDPIENIWWLHDDSRMNHERCDTGMCVVRFLSCAEPPSSCISPSTAVQPSSTASVGPIDFLSTQITAPAGATVVTPTLSTFGRLGTPLDTSSYRIPMLPLVTHSQENNAIQFRPPSPTLGQPYVRFAPPITHTHSGLPSSSVFSIGTATCRGSTRSRNLPLTSLRRHPHLPNRQRQSTISSASSGCIPLTPEHPITRTSPFPLPRSTRQLVSGSDSVQTTSSHLVTTSMTNSIMSALPTGFSRSESSQTNIGQTPFNDSSSNEPSLSIAHHRINPPRTQWISPFSLLTGRDENTTTSDALCSHTLERPSEDIPDHVEPVCSSEIPHSNFIATSDHSRNSTTSSLTNPPNIRFFPPRLQPTTSRRSSCSNPTLLTNVHNSALTCVSRHSHHLDLFRSVEALNILPSQHQSWLGAPDSVHHASDLNSDILLSRLNADESHFGCSAGEDQDEVVFSDILDRVRSDNLFHCLRLAENSPEDRELELLSDDFPEDEDNHASGAHSPSSPSRLCTDIVQMQLTDSIEQESSRGGVISSPSVLPSLTQSSSAGNSSCMSIVPTSQTKTNICLTPRTVGHIKLYDSSLHDSLCSSNLINSAFCPNPCTGDGPPVQFSIGSGLHVRQLCRPASPQLTHSLHRWTQHSPVEGDHRSPVHNDLSGSAQQNHLVPAMERREEPSTTVHNLGEEHQLWDGTNSNINPPLSSGTLLVSMTDIVSSSEPITTVDRGCSSSSAGLSPMTLPDSDCPSAPVCVAPPMECAIGHSLRRDTVGDTTHPTTVSIFEEGQVSSGVSEQEVASDSHPDQRSDGEGEEGDDLSSARRNPAIGQTDDLS